MNPVRWLWRLVFEDEDLIPDPDDDVVLGMPPDNVTAMLWQDLLERNGVHCMLGGPEVRVLYRDLDRARHIVGLESVDEPTYAIAASDLAADVIAPASDITDAR